VTESGGEHATLRLPINAVADDRSFVTLQASGSDEREQSWRRPAAAGRRGLVFVSMKAGRLSTLVSDP
jgi:hypothetical protein